MEFEKASVQINKFLGGLGSWTPSELYIGLCSGVVISASDPTLRYIVDTELTIPGYTRKQLDKTQWDVNVSTGSRGGSSTSTYDGAITYTLGEDYHFVNYFLTDEETGAGTIVAVGAPLTTTNVSAGQEIAISGIAVTLNHQGVGAKIVGWFYTGFLTDDSKEAIQKHYLAVEPMSGGSITLQWLAEGLPGQFGGSFGSTNLSSFSFNASDDFLYLSDPVHHTFNSDGFVKYTGIDVGGTRYINLINHEIGGGEDVGINWVTTCGDWFSSLQQWPYYPFTTLPYTYDETLVLHFVQ